MRAMRYALEEALVNLRRAGRSAAMSVGTIAIAFFTLGGFLLIAANLQSVVERWASAAEMSVYLRDDADEAARALLEGELRENRSVAAIEYISKDQALERFRSDFPELADVAVATTGNPFPASLEVRLRSDPESAGAADHLASVLLERSGVADVRYDRQWLSRLLAIVTGVRLTGLAIATLLVVGAAFTVAAVVRLSLVARRDELEIMQLVGAPFAFIRGPSIAEGTLLGAVGAGLALLVLWAVFTAARASIGEVVTAFAGTGELRFLGLREGALLVAASLVVGALTGTLASRVVR